MTSANAVPGKPRDSSEVRKKRGEQQDLRGWLDAVADRVELIGRIGLTVAYVKRRGRLMDQSAISNARIGSGFHDRVGCASGESEYDDCQNREAARRS